MSCNHSVDPQKNPPNPKQRYGDLKPDLSLVPGVATAHEALALEDGAAKYGPYNWRDKAVEARTYVAAAKRHIDDWLDGEEFSVDTVAAGRPVHNLAHARACLAILLDCIEIGNLIDNRPKPGKSSEMHERVKAQREARKLDDEVLTHTFAPKELYAVGRISGDDDHATAHPAKLCGCGTHGCNPVSWAGYRCKRKGA